jgi:lysophospholipase L1-like esterase
MRWADVMGWRLTWVIAGALLVLAFAGVIGASLLARHFYFRFKLAAAEPVAYWVYADENAALLRRDAGQGPGRQRIVLIGDSRVRPMRLEALESEWEILNRGINGETSAQMRLRFANDVMALQPDVVIIQSGINDLVAGIGSKAKAPAITARTTANLKWVAEQAAAAGSKVVLLTVIPPADPDLARRLVWSEGIREQVAAVNADLLAWKPPQGVRVLDLGGVFEATTRLHEKFALDTLHLNETGYSLLGEKLGRLVLSMADP